jgi:hypothetical protein
VFSAGIFLQEPVIFLKNPGSYLIANYIVKSIAQKAAINNNPSLAPHSGYCPHWQPSTGGKQQRIAWQKRHHYHTRFYKYDQKKDNIRPGAVL